MGNHQDNTTNNQASSEGQQPRNNNSNVNVDFTGVVFALGSSTSPNPSARPSTGQTSVGGGFPYVTPPRPHRGSPSPPSTGQVNVGRGGSPYLTPPRPYRGTSPSTRTPPRGSPSRRSPSSRGSPSTRRGFSPSGIGTPSSRIGSSSSGRGMSPTPSSGVGQMNQLGGRTSGSVNVEISLGSSVTLGSSTVPTGGSPGKRKADVVPPKGVNPVCSVCKRTDFCSWKALFGHMRCHPDRQWRGCFPPPGFEEAAQQALQQGEGGSGQIFGFDLNEARPPDQEELVEVEQPPGKFDLNMPPADDKDDEDNGRGAA